LERKQKALRRILFLLVLIISPFLVAGQDQVHGQFFRKSVSGNDTIFETEISDVVVLSKRIFKNKREEHQYSRYVQKVKKVYPYALKAKELLIKYEPVFNTLEKQSDKRKLMKTLEDELLRQHINELKRWSISDGTILIKLISRETHKTAFNIIKDYRGDIRAVFWQGIARIFKNNLKTNYDPYGDDLMLEQIVTLIELGYI
jgi:hypothetical protein